MKTRAFVVGILVVAACTGGEQQQIASTDPQCGDRVVTAEGVGELRIGRSIDSVRALCRVLRDTTEIRQEGQPTRVATVLLGSDTIEAEIDSGKVWRIRLTQPGLATSDSLSVGMPLSELLQHGDAVGDHGEGKVYVILREKCGMSFGLDIEPGRVATSELDEKALAKLPSDVTIDTILIFGCRERGT
jgi:hypothetical protein